MTLTEAASKKIEPAVLEGICTTAQTVAQEIRQNSLIAAKKTQCAWQTFTSSLKRQSIDWWTGSFESFIQFCKQERLITKNMRPATKPSLDAQLDTLWRSDDYWKYVWGYSVHDFGHLSPTFIYSQITNAIENAHMMGEPFLLHHNHKEFFDKTAQQFTTLASLQAYSMEMIAALTRAKQGYALPTEQFTPFNLAEQIAMFVKGESPDDYRIVTVDTAKQNENVNRILVDIPQNLSITANKALFFTILQNLGNNAMLVLSKQHWKENDQALLHFYSEHKPLRHPRAIRLTAELSPSTITFVIEDEGPGLTELPQGANIFDHLRQPDIQHSWMLNRGLGLHIIKLASQFLGATPSGTNRPEGGARFSLTFPNERLNPS